MFFFLLVFKEHSSQFVAIEQAEPDLEPPNQNTFASWDTELYVKNKTTLVCMCLPRSS